MSRQRLFVYGSLLPGGRNEHVLADLPGEWRRAGIRGRLLEAGWGAAMGYPGLVLDDGGETVPGCVFTSDALATEWQRLDDFEGSEYRRVQADVTLDDRRTVRAFVYVVRDDGA